MSEENTEVVNNNEEKKCKCKIWACLVIVSLILSIASLTTSIYALNKGGTAQGENQGKQVVISKQYDKGQSLEKAQKTGKPMIVFFYTDWCGFCQRFIPTFAKVTKSKEIKKNFAIAYVNCEESDNTSIMQNYDVHAFPTVFVVKEDGTKTQLNNNTFFDSNSVEVIKNTALELIK